MANISDTGGSSNPDTSSGYIELSGSYDNPTYTYHSGDRLNHSQKLRHLLDALDELQTENERLKAEVDEHKTTKNGVPRGSSSVALRRSMSWGGR